MATLKGIKALRLSYLTDGEPESMVKIPPIRMFMDNESDEYEFGSELTEETVINIVNKNSFRDEGEGGLCLTVYAFISMINHGEPNIVANAIPPYLHMWYACRDIKAGEQILIDYIGAIDDKK